MCDGENAVVGASRNYTRLSTLIDGGSAVVIALFAIAVTMVSLPARAVQLEAPEPGASLGPTGPYVYTQPPGKVTKNSAQLNATVVPNGSDVNVWFEFGTTTNNWGSTWIQQVVGGTGCVRVSLLTGDLTEGTIYHYRAVALDGAGHTNYGAEVQFTTGLRVVAWGRASLGNNNVPADLNNAVAIACGHGHSLALRNDGTVVAWGGQGTSDFDSYEGYGSTNVPAGLSDVVAIAGGFSHSLAVKSDGTVAAWGQYMDHKPVFVPQWLNNVIAVAGGDYHSMALRSDGTVVVWGDSNQSGQTNVPAGLSNVVAIAAGSSHCLALRADGTVVAWGDSYGVGATTVPSGLTGVIGISSDAFTCYALKADGTIRSWGSDAYGQASGPLSAVNVIGVAAGWKHCIALLSNGTVTGWGDNTYLQRTPPVGLRDVIAIASGDLHCLALAWGQPPLILSGPASKMMHAGDGVAFSVTVMGSTPLYYQWQLNGKAIPGATAKTYVIANAEQSALGSYSVTIRNLFGSVTSAGAILCMYPYVATPFTGGVVLWGSDATLSVQAGGSGPLTFQWFRDGVAVPNGTNATLVIPGIQFTNAGLYSVVVTSPYGSVTNTPASVTVNPADIALGTFPGVILNGVVGLTYLIEASTDPATPGSWTEVGRVTLEQPQQIWVDTNCNTAVPENPRRFYRVAAGQ